MPFLDGWTKQKSITIPAGYITGSLTNFPMSVQFTDDAEIGAAALANGFDIRFTLSDGTTVLSCYRRSFSIAVGLATGIYDVLVPSLTSGVPGSLLCQYGNAAAADVSSSSAVFGAAGAGFAGAWGFGDGVTLDLTDLTGNGNDGTNNGATAAAGQVGGAASFDGLSYYVEIGNKASLDLTTAITLSAWVWSDVDIAGWQTILSRRPSASNVQYSLAKSGGTNKLAFAGGPSWWGILSTATIPTGVWTHVTSTYVGSTKAVLLYIDGAASGGGTGQATITSQTANNQIGKNQDNTYPERWDGLIDEPRISPVARSAPWIYLDYNQIANQSSVVLWGAEETATTTVPVDVLGLTSTLQAPVPRSVVLPAVLNATATMQNSTPALRTLAAVQALTVAQPSVVPTLIMLPGAAALSAAIWDPGVLIAETRERFGRPASSVSRGSGTVPAAVVTPQRGGSYGRA